MHSIPEYGEKSKVKSCKLNAYQGYCCLLLLLKHECLLNDVELVMNVFPRLENEMFVCYVCLTGLSMAENKDNLLKAKLFPLHL